MNSLEVLLYLAFFFGGVAAGIFWSFCFWLIDKRRDKDDRC